MFRNYDTADKHSCSCFLFSPVCHANMQNKKSFEMCVSKKTDRKKNSRTLFCFYENKFKQNVYWMIWTLIILCWISWIFYLTVVVVVRILTIKCLFSFCSSVVFFFFWNHTISNVAVQSWLLFFLDKITIFAKQYLHEIWYIIEFIQKCIQIMSINKFYLWYNKEKLFAILFTYHLLWCDDKVYILSLFLDLTSKVCWCFFFEISMSCSVLAWHNLAWLGSVLSLIRSLIREHG